MHATRILPICAICALALGAVTNWARPKDDQVFDGIAVQQNLSYEFFPGAKDCDPKGTSYLLIPNKGFHELVQESADIGHLEDLFHGTWKMKLRGNLSRIGRF